MEFQRLGTASKMTDTFESTQDWRYERKFLIENCDCHMLEQVIFSNKMFFSRLYAERNINNIYFDTDDFFCFVQSVAGQSQRRKLRVRWYGDTFGKIDRPALEIKIKEALVGRKRRYRLQSFEFNDSFDGSAIRDSFSTSELPETVSNLLATMSPVLLNSYRRRYFISSDRRYRLTLDYDLTFYKMPAGRNTLFSKRQTNNLVVEIKYDAGDDNDIDLISNDFPFRMTKSSKYVQGISATLLNI